MIINSSSARKVTTANMAAPFCPTRCGGFGAISRALNPNRRESSELFCGEGGAGRALERLSWAQNGGGKVRMVNRIRVMLRFQAESSVLRIKDAADAGLLPIQMIGRVKLHAGLGGAQFQHPTAGRLDNTRRQNQ